MSFEEHLQLWSRSALFVSDIRRAALRRNERINAEAMPGSAFLLIHQGSAEIDIDRERHRFSGPYVCHAPKGARLSIDPVGDLLEYDLIYYKAVLSPPYWRNLLRLQRENNPFLTPFGFAPSRHLVIYALAEEMHRLWGEHGQLERFQARALFYQLGGELLRQLRELETGEAGGSDLVSQAVRYMEARYGESLTLQELASALQSAPRSLQRQFKAKMDVSPMDYLIGIRMKRASDMLAGTGATLREIAEATGYADSYYFSRAFKKYSGFSPLQYRNNCRKSPSELASYSIGVEEVLSYSVIDSANHYQYKREGDRQVVKRTKSMLAVSVMLSLILLLGACSGGTGGARNNGGEGTAASPTTAAATVSPTPAAQASYPVTIEDLKGSYTLEQKPERIAVLDTKFVDQLVTLQEQPAGSVTAAGSDSDFPEYLADRLTDVKVLGTRDEPNLEAIVAMDPDLILITGFQEKVYDSVSKIAPTIMLDFDEDWKDTLVTVGKIVGKEQEANLVLEEYKEKISSLKERLQAKLNGESVALLRPRDGEIRVHTPGHRTGAILYNDLGLTVPESVAQQEDTAYHISLEALADVGADHYFLLTDDMFKDQVQEFQNTTTWQSLEPVKQNRVYTVDTTLWIAYYGPIAINMIVDQVEEALLGGN
ncbi:ABC transporter substrate-binding protein [Paenibacillus sp. CAU 1782]